jgi:aryl-alcohol dehydrogenase-like predicted oxidoreductase
MTVIAQQTLGRTGFVVGALGLGTGWIGEAPDLSLEERDAAAVDAVHSAIEHGMNYIDTAPSYRQGLSERRTGLALAGPWRARVRLATKVGTHPERPGDFSEAAVQWSVEQSLRVLGTDVIDVLLVHDPEDMAPVLARGGALDTLERLKSQQVVRAIGLGVQNHAHQRLALATGRFDVVQLPYDYNLLRTTSMALLEITQAQHIGAINASPFQQGLLAGVDPQEVMRLRAAFVASAVRTNDTIRATRLWQWSRERGIDLRALAVQFCLRETRFATTLVGPRTRQEVEEDVQAATTPIPEAHWQALAALMPTLPDASGGGELSVGAIPPIV